MLKRSKSKTKKWNRAGNWSAALFASLAVVTPAVTVSSCSCSTKQVFIDDMDREYNVSSVTYKNMKDEFRTLYEIDLKKQSLSDEEKQEKMDDLNYKISTFDEQITDSKESGENYVNYVSLTGALSQVALEDYGIQLNRDSTATWQDLRDQYNGFRDSNEIYMHNLRLPESQIASVLANADRYFDNIMIDLQAAYPNDPLSGLINGGPRILDAFESTNLDIASLAASNRLKDFLSKYTFVFRDDYPDNGNRFDIIKPKLVERLNLPIKDNLMNMMFYCVEGKTHNKIYFKGDETIPGYRLCPILHSINEDPYTNTYTISIDWSLTDTHYVGDPEKEELATGHLYGEIELDEKIAETKSIAEIVASGKHIYMDYNLYPTKSYEEQQLAKAYFNPSSEKGMVCFKWDDDPKSPNNKYECFFSGIKPKEKTGTLSLAMLGDSGLMIGDGKYYRNVNDVMKENSINPDTDDSLLPLYQLFLKHCEISSTVNIVNPKTHEVTNDFAVKYNNSINPNAAYRGLSFKNNGYLVSPEFYDQANQAYNLAQQFVNVYASNVFKKAQREVDDCTTSLLVGTACAGAWDAYYIFRLIMPIANVQKASYAQVLAYSIAEIALWMSWFAFMMAELWVPLDKLVEKNNKIMRDPDIKELIDKVKKDAVYFALPDENGDFHKESQAYKDKYEKFASADFEDETLPLYQYYCNFDDQQEVKKLKQLLVDNDITPEVVNNIVQPWLLFNTFYTASWVWAGAQWVVARLFGPTLVDPTKKSWAYAWAGIQNFIVNQAITWSVWGLAYVFRWVALGIAPFAEDGTIYKILSSWGIL